MARLKGSGGAVYVGQQIIEDCEDAWAELVDGDVTESADTTDYKVGSASAKFVCAAGIANGDIIATEVVASMDLSSYDTLMWWAKSSVAITTAGDLALLMDDTALCASPITTTNFPVLAAGVWKLCIAAETLTSATAIISVGAKLVANDPGAFDLNIDHIMAAKAVAGIKSWTIDQVMNTAETTAFDSSGHKDFIPTLDEWSGSFEGYKDGPPLTIGTVVHLDLRESATATQKFFGSAIITGLHESVPVDGVVTINYDFQGIKELTIPTA